MAEGESLLRRMTPERRTEWLVQLRWQTSGWLDAAGHLMRVCGAEAEYHVSLLRTYAQQAEELIARLEAELKVIEEEQKPRKFTPEEIAAIDVEMKKMPIDTPLHIPNPDLIY